MAGAGILTNFSTRYLPLSIPIIGFLIGAWFDRRSDFKMSDYHNKSSLFGGRDLKPGERAW